ncbi:RNA polymerase sigma factor [Lewinella sp. 4G2]|uniref:RNA polymerase sigma factor n=1 Tax=Lewinella sp. 4G2 TaxID=1803372 RepID=UPI0007E2A3F9|nr:RNA polymerase sigma factor [Lewinella sp. 4G2]OAV45881.1 hypothetical protein A3850_010725 [Lewinella sp. 4G2]
MAATSSPENLPPPPSLSDAALAQEINAGNERLLGELYNRYAGKIYYKCLGMMKDAGVAQDMAHDVFIKVSLNLHRYQGTADLSFWIYAITYNHCIAQLKKDKRLRFGPIDENADREDEGDIELEAKVISDLRLTQLKRVLQQLRPDEAILLTMRYQDGMSVKQIAAILKLGESAVKMRLKRGRSHLAKLMNDLDDE